MITAAGKTLLLVLLSTSVMAAIPKQALMDSQAVEDILSMPEKNRYLVAEKKVDELYPRLVQLAANTKKNLGVRWKSLTLAAHLKRQESVKEIRPYLNSNEWYMRNAALVALEQVSAAEAQKAAIDLLDDKALVVRSAAVEALGTDLTAPLRDRLWEELRASYNFRKKESLWVRAQIAEKLSLSPEKAEVEKFVGMLKEQDARLHAPGVAALEKLTGEIKGSAKASIEERRGLWLKWARN
jgi:HEAT repeat protein